MKARDIALALVIAIVWGANFSVIEIGLRSFPPLLFAALRFAVVALVALVVFRPPTGHWRYVLQYGLYMGLLQFGCLFFAMNGHADAGTSALVLQAQVPLTMLMAGLLLREKATGIQWLGVVIAGAALGLLYVNQSGRMDAFGLMLTLFAAINFAAGNLTMRRAQGISGIQLVAWSCVLPPLTLLGLSLLLEGPTTVQAFAYADFTGWVALAYVSLLATLGGFGFWGVLLGRYGTGRVLPFSFCVPIFAQIAAALILQEPLGMMEWGVTLGVVAGAMLCQVLARPSKTLASIHGRLTRRRYGRKTPAAECRACV
ncbi:MAG: EamA family transporter [Pseudomonadota bacterium]